MSGQEPPRALFRCDGATVPDAWKRCSWDIELPVITRGASQDLDLKVEPLAAKVVGTISARAADLVRLAAYVYAADQMLSRGGPVDVHREHWRRQLALCVPVSDPAFWASSSCTDALQQALGFLTDDDWMFAFVQGGPEGGQLPLGIPELPLVENPDAVVLFSGGTDSLCALVDHVAAGGRPLVVSHRSAPQLDRWQRDLLRSLRGRFQDWRFPQLSFWVQRRGGDAANSAQRTRAFLYAALGAAAAGQIGIRSVLLPDNGYVSLNPPISAQLVGALASRSTHPTFLRLFNRLLDGAFSTSVQVHNPLTERTRAEALAVLQPNECADLLTQTHSCGNHRGRTNAVPHCGGCSQCVDRRFASVAAGLEAHDPAERYGIDIFTDELPEGEARTIAESYVRFARATMHATDDDLLLDCPQLIGAFDPDDERLAETGIGLIDLLRRHADEVIGVLDTMVVRHSRLLAQGELPATCLLSMVVGPGQTSDQHDEAGPNKPSQMIESASVATENGPTENRFERKHGVWHVSFRGEKGTYPRSKGMERLARLLAASGLGISALDLKVGPGSGASTQDPVNIIPQDGVHIDDYGALGEIMDRQYADQLKDRATELHSQIDAARQEGDEEQAEQWLSDLEWISQELGAATGLHGRRRKFGDAHEAARKTVQKTLSSTIAGFAPDLPELHAHLLRWVSFGMTCRYGPVPPEHWQVAL